MKITGDCFNPNESVLLQALDMPVDEQTSLKLREAELRWHYSLHYYAENFGEELLEDMLANAPTRRLKALLEAQLRDELRHASLYKKVTDQIGFDERARQFGDRYSMLVKSQSRFCEKVFAFQMLTEAVALGYVTWRLDAINDAHCNATDLVVQIDEGRHLKMAQPLLLATPREELEISLPAERRKTLMREMIALSAASMKEDLITTVIPEFIKDAPIRLFMVGVDRCCIKAVVNQAKQYDNYFAEIKAQSA